MRRHEFLAGLHERLQPRTYFEIGVSTGSSLTLSRTRSVGVDPAFAVKNELLCDLHLVRATSDEFFDRDDPLAHFAGTDVDLAFIDGMHLAEYALRDFINTERYCGPASVVVLDDMLPKSVPEANRDRSLPRRRRAWAGDVYKVTHVLRRLRPDLVVLEIDTAPTGVVVVLCPDPGNDVLAEAYDGLVPGLVTPDPQSVPEQVLHRTRAVDPERLLASAIWDDLVAARSLGTADARRAVDAALDSAWLRSAGGIAATGAD